MEGRVTRHGKQHTGELIQTYPLLWNYCSAEMRAPHLQVCSSHMHASCPLRHSKLIPILHACSCCCFQHFCQTPQEPEGHHHVLVENSISQLPVPAAASALCASATGTVLLMSLLLLLLLLLLVLVVDGCNQGHAARRPQPGGNLLEPGRGGDLKQERPVPLQ